MPDSKYLMNGGPITIILYKAVNFLINENKSNERNSIISFNACKCIYKL